jgi:hypothetical protein
MSVIVIFFDILNTNAIRLNFFLKDAFGRFIGFFVFPFTYCDHPYKALLQS